MESPEIPDLAGKVDPRHVSTLQTGRFKAEYINWSRVKNYLRIYNPDWVPFCVPNEKGGIEHEAPNSSFYLLISFRHIPTGYELPPVPHGQDLPKESSGRDLSDAYVRGMCKAAAFHFGLAWELWSKDDPMVRRDQK